MAFLSPTKKGFTLIELMIVVAIIGLLAAIALPKFSNLVRKSKEASIRGKLGCFRSAMSLYYADNEGVRPYVPGGAGPGIAFDVSVYYPKYIQDPMSLDIPEYHHAVSNYIANQLNMMYPDPPDMPMNVPRWFVPHDALNLNIIAGDVHILCTHTDVNGTTWSLW